MRHLPLLIAALGCCPAAAFAQEIPVSLRLCAAEADPALRLDCYDRQIPPAKRSAVGAGAPRAGPAARPAVAPAPAVPPLRHIASISLRARTPAEYTLDNGEVWRQMDTAPFTVDVGDAVTIQRGPVGGLWLQTDARHGTRVSRVR